MVSFEMEILKKYLDILKNLHEKIAFYLHFFRIWWIFSNSRQIFSN